MKSTVLLSVVLLRNAHLCAQVVGDPGAEPQPSAEVLRVEAAIIHVVKDGLPQRKIAPHRNHRILKKSSERRLLAESIVAAAEKYDVPAMLLVATAYRENSFGDEKIGAIGEKSTFQILPFISKCIREAKFPWSDVAEPLCTLKTTAGSALCASALLSIHRERCGTIEGAMALYISGRTCVPDTRRIKWVIRDRFYIAAYLEGKFKDGNDRSD